MICVSLSGLTYQECINAIGKSEYAEVRMDLLDLSDSQLQGLFSIKQKTVATCRPGKHDTHERLRLLKSAIDAGAGYVDIEFEAEELYREELTNYAHEKGKKVILSYHNFEMTPSAEELQEIILKSRSMGCDIVKIATMANSGRDNSVVLSLYKDFDNIIAFCMGKKGMISRVAAPLLGAEFTFAALSSRNATAPGQFTREELLDIFDFFDYD